MSRPLGSLLLALWIPASLAGATAQRTFVSTGGNDANACTLTQPCRGFTRALTQTSSGGEIIVLDSGGYGAVTIAKSVSIIAPPGVYGGMSVFSGTGILVNGAAIRVELRGLTITGLGGVIGINLLNAASVVIADCRVSGMTGSGLVNNGVAKVHVQDSTFRDNGGAGISVQSGATTLVRVVSRDNGGAGVSATGAVVTVVDGQIHYNGGAGVDVDSSGYLTINNSTIQSNGSSGVNVESGAVARIDRSLISVNALHGVASTSDHEIWIARSAIEDNNQTSGVLSELCACGNSAIVRMTESVVHAFLAPAALETVPGTAILLYSNNSIRGNDTGGGTINSVPLR